MRDGLISQAVDKKLRCVPARILLLLRMPVRRQRLSAEQRQLQRG
jgi:hypothetical protein